MFTRRFKQAFARFCIALLCLQSVVAAYACPAFLGELPAEAAASVDAQHVHHAAAAAHCDEHPAPDNGERSVCHEHYAGEQSVGSATLVSVGAAPVLPLAIVATVKPAAAAARTVLPVLLERNTAPPLSIRFLVLRI